MKSVYNFLMHLSTPVLEVLGVFSPKMKAFTQGRKGLFERLRDKTAGLEKVVWMHAASLGEYEQGLPILQELKAKYQDISIVISFFSPSGFEVKKDNAFADAVTYLPLDTAANVTRFLDLVRPQLAIFVKYEVWPNLFFELEKREIPNILVSAVFKPTQAFFKPHGKLLLKALKTLDWIFVQNKSSLNLLQGHGFSSCSLSGDTRFDRVSKQIEQNNSLEFMEAFSSGETTLVLGSTWPEDETLFLSFLKSEAGKSIKTVIAPHAMNESLIAQLDVQLGDLCCRFSNATTDQLSKSRVLILDTVGYLSKVYSYADIAYVGGGMGTSGLHNILEPATFGMPIIIGKNYQGFPEAIKLRELAGLYSVMDAREFEQLVQRFLNDVAFRNQTGMICEHFVNSNTGATRKIIDHINGSYADRLS